MQVLSCSVLAVSEGVEKTFAMAVEKKLGFHQTLKQMFRERLKFKPKPLEWIQDLPANPDELKRSHSAIWESLYASEPPVPSPIPELHMAQLRSTTRCRSWRKGATMQGSSAMSSLSLLLGSCSPQQGMAAGVPQPFLQMGMQIMNEIAQLKGQLGGSSSSPASPAEHLNLRFLPKAPLAQPQGPSMFKMLPGPEAANSQ